MTLQKRQEIPVKLYVDAQPEIITDSNSTHAFKHICAVGVHIKIN